MSTTPEDGTADNRAVTAPTEWNREIERRGLPSFDPAQHASLVVLAAHPDDATLGAGGVLRTMHAAGVRLTLIVATDGEARPELDPPARPGPAGARTGGHDDALAALGLGAVPVHRLGLPGSGLEACAGRLERALVPLLAGAEAFLSPWPHDPDPDHAAVGRAAAAAAPAAAHGWSYPIRMWARMSPDDPTIAWDRARALVLDGPSRAARAAAVRCRASQVRPRPDGSPAVLAAGLLDHLDRDVDLVFREPRSAPALQQRFTDLYADGDPWQADSWYERRKRAVVLACLPRERYRTVFEPGAGAGELTLGLADRADRVLASDPVPAATGRAATATRDRPGVSVTTASLPDAVPDERIDLAVFSEVLYYLDDDTVTATLDRTLDATPPGADVVVVHWRGFPPEAPRDAEATHRMIRARPELETVAEHVDEHFVLVVLRRR